jgi:plastocyanin
MRFLALASAGALIVAGVAAAATMAAPDLAGTIGPGFTISLKNAGKNVATLKHGKYVFMVRDKSNIHNFTLNGPGIRNKTITATGFVGMKTATLTLSKGGYRFYCTVHPSVAGTFEVT